MPPAKRRKVEPASEEASEEPVHSAINTEDSAPEGDEMGNPDRDDAEPEDTTTEHKMGASSSTEADASSKAMDRMARFRALQARAKTSSEQNLKETAKESQRLATDPSALTALHRRRDLAQWKLLKAETEEGGEDFERKRAWDWTAEERRRNGTSG
ncbi:hypothetical protein NPX13_g10998 [Xylaria arbuscula]|uniref:Uncharacterized protein n=1 Tax=Xylaria arbuscula TaxID=114810 RepID=A0A9W8THC9_9PEZI|nr:hypothetical protein NPX13_g10998 [Xylaria arbuscula]